MNDSFHSSGVSIKMYGNESPIRPNESSAGWRHSGQHDEETCVFGKCRKTSCCKCVPCGTMRIKFDCAICSLVSVAVVALFFAVLIPVVVNSLVDEMVNEQLIIDSPNAPSYKAWQTNANPDSTTTISYKLHFFDIQNPKEIVKGEIPYVVELGPYAFKEYYNNFDIHWTDDGDTVTLNNQRYYVFDPANTVPGLTLNDSLTLSYPTVLGFEWLIDTIPVEATEFMDYLIEAKLYDTYGNLENDLDGLIFLVNNSTSLNRIEKKKLTNELNDIKTQVTKFYNGLADFVAVSNPADLSVKTILCSLPEIGVSPFWKTNPVPAYFGWLVDPVLMEVLQIIKKIEAKYNTTIPWSVAVPGVASNYTTVEDARRRKGPSTFKTGKKNIREVNKFVTYNNETSMWVCVSSMSSQNVTQYIPGEEFPACEISQYDWNASTYAAKGYRQPFATPFANRIQGSDGNLVAKPVVTEHLQLFIGDIYRSAYLALEGPVDWYDVKLMRYQIQAADLLNATSNPNNEQYYGFGPSGLLNLSLAASAPSFASFPHFLHGDSSLVAGVRGLSPNPAIHNSYLDYEPQTGLLTRAAKRLQLVYYHNDTSFPNMPPSFGTAADDICLNFTKVKNELNALNITSITFSCNVSAPRDMLTCLSEPQDWRYNNGGVYLPYAWVEEGVDGSEDDANTLKDTLYFIEDLANDIEFWGLFAAGIATFTILAMLFTRDYLLVPNGSTSSAGFFHGFEDDKKEPLLANAYQFDNSDLR